MVERIDASGTLRIVLGSGSADVDDDVGVNVLDRRVDVVAEIIDAFVLQSHAVEHSFRRLHHARIVVAFAGVERRTFDDNAANAVEGHEIGKFKTVAERAGGGHDGIL